MTSRLSHFGPYELLYEIGRGASAVVYVARRNEHGDVVALKIAKQPGRDSASAVSIRDEARLLSLLRHPNILRPSSLVEQDDHVGLVEEYVHGEPLSELMRAGSIPEAVALGWTERIASALAHAHGAVDPATGRPLGVVHRDLAPDNILIRYDGRPVLADFGIAMSRATRAETRTGVIKGRIEFLAPEQIAGRPVDGRADVYALAVLLEKMLEGRETTALLSATLAAAQTPDPADRPSARAFSWGLRRAGWWLPDGGDPDLVRRFAEGRMLASRREKDAALRPLGR